MRIKDEIFVKEKKRESTNNKNKNLKLDLLKEYVTSLDFIKLLGNEVK
mgnify:CR=1 FL=1